MNKFEIIDLDFNCNAGWGGGGNGVILLFCWVSLNNSELVKAVILAFSSIQKHFIREIHAKFGITNLPKSPDIVQNSDRGISDSQISGQSDQSKRNIVMTLEPVIILT